ncbi:hypothetical protein GCM10010844_18560 [Deinococcus radiotolerans]|uniref:Diguanylate cyclase n=2 Tax=Deinococcus radiotolerans TaxID=1309407 RepID=A0ABQ2FJ83_9DEIO|nr:hypothetical protein GCM10010844_18560 [Deinococcus radiotolerans]
MDTGPGSARDPLRILIIDDSPEDAGHYVHQLAQINRGICCHHAELGEVGARLLDEFQPDCVLLDYYLPDMTGLEFLEQYRPQVPVLVITGSAEQTVAAHVMRAGASRLLYKGGLPGGLLHEQILECVHEHALRGQLALQRQRMQAVLDSTGHGLLFARPEVAGWTVDFLNPAARELLGVQGGPLEDASSPLSAVLHLARQNRVPTNLTAKHAGRTLALECAPGADGFTVTVRDASLERRREQVDRARHRVLHRFVESRAHPEVLRDLQDLIEATLPGVRGHLLTGPHLLRWPHLGALDVRVDHSVLRSGDAPARFVPGPEGGWALPVTATDEDALLGVLVIEGPADLDVPGALQDVVGLTTLLLMHTRDQQRLQFQAWRDPLTGLPNRSVFMDQLQRELHGLPRSRSSLAVGILDLDGFKGVNDTFGHAGGDALLIEVGRRLNLAFRASDLVARVGGDEFTLLLTDWLDPGTLEADLHGRLRQVLGAPFELEGTPVPIRASLGVAVAPRQSLSPDGLLHLADRAMYRAKRAGGGLHVSTEVPLPT